MYAKNLEGTLFELCQKGDVSGTVPQDIMERFESLRGYRKLPYGRERRAQPLTDCEIAGAILGLVPKDPKWTGNGAIVLCNLHTVGGSGASFFGTTTLEQAIATIVSDSVARKSVVRLMVSCAEVATNSHGTATLVYETEGEQRRAFYVSKLAVSQLQPGAERAFDEEFRQSPLSREVSFNRGFFDRIARDVEMARKFSKPPEGDGSEYNAEEARQELYRRLGAVPGSRFFHIGVDNQVTWPKEAIVVTFETCKLVLMPKTREHMQSIHIDLTANRLSDREAHTVINRFLSVLTWCDDQFAVAQGGWSGNPVPVPVPRRNLAFTTAHGWILDRKIPDSENARRALALYREARNAQQNFMVSYAVLNFYKIVEIGQQNPKGDTKRWFKNNFEAVRQKGTYKAEFDRFVALCNGESPHEYIYEACRIAVAHASEESTSDPDDANELVRLHTVADVLRILARHFIATELKVPEGRY